MKSDKFELIYKKSIRLYSLYFKHDLKFDNYISSLYKRNNKVSIDNIKDSIIRSKTINIDEYTFTIYKFKVNHLMPIELDDNYNLLPQKEVVLYECGLSVSRIKDNELFEITGVFEKCNENISLIDNEYCRIQKIINSNDISSILTEIEKYIDQKIIDVENMLN